jgi:hypothetical protein
MLLCGLVAKTTEIDKKILRNLEPAQTVNARIAIAMDGLLRVVTALN